MSRPDLITGWLPLPSGVAAAGRLFVLSDLHGRADLMTRALDWAAASSDGHALAILGDLTDRGPDSLGCVRAALAARASGAFSRVITLTGNHDQVLCDLLADPKSATARIAVRQMGGKGLLAQMDADPEALTDLRRYAEGLTPWSRCGGLALTHAVPDPGKVLGEQTEISLFWNAGNLAYRGGWDRLIGAPCVLVHGHVRNGASLRGRGASEVEAEVFATLAAHRRVCCDLGTPWTGEAAIFEFSGAEFRVVGFWEDRDGR